MIARHYAFGTCNVLILCLFVCWKLINARLQATLCFRRWLVISLSYHRCLVHVGRTIWRWPNPENTDFCQCSPQSRSWPQKCSECLRLGYNCSPSQRAVRRRRKLPTQTEIHVPNTLNTYSEPAIGAQEEEGQRTEPQAQYVASLQAKVHMLERQVQHHQSKNAVHKELNELRESYARQERNIEELLKTVQNLERQVQDMAIFHNLE